MLWGENKVKSDAAYALLCYCYTNTASLCCLPQKLVQTIDVGSYGNTS